MATFSDFKKKFYDRIGDGTLFNCGDINLLKVVLDGLHVNYVERWSIPVPLFGSLAAHKRFLQLRRLKMRMKKEAVKALDALDHIRNARGCDYLLVDTSGRSVPDDLGQRRSIYYENILTALGRKKCFFIVESDREPLFSHDMHYPAVCLWLQLSPMSAEDLVIRQQLKDTYARIKAAQIFISSELQNIRIAFQRFFDTFRIWYRIASLLKPRVAIFDQHYHREGFLFALHRLGVPTVELQHGLIAKEDIFYVFPPAVKGIIGRALFADRILVYGDFWKQRLLHGCEYPIEHIGIIGYYHFESERENRTLSEELRRFSGSNHLLLVTTQTSMHDYYIAFVEWLARDIAEKKLPWRILVKPHPAEKEGTYARLVELGGVQITNGNLEHLFPVCDLHLSVYSTTLFDAIRFGVKNYALYVPAFGDYVDAMINDGIAEKVDRGVSFLLYAEKEGRPLPQKDHFYSKFMPEKFASEMERLSVIHDRMECKRCILTSEDDPALSLDAEGICNYCRQYEKDVRERLIAARPDAQARVKVITDKIRQSGKGKRYDCILGVSGGVDSTYLAYVASQLGLRPLLVHFDNGWNSELAVMNIQNIAQKLGFELYTYVIDWEEFRDLQVAFLKASVVDIELLTDHAISAVIYQAAKKYNVRYILSGTNIVTEGVLPPHWVHRKSDWLNIKSIHKRFGKLKLKKYPHWTYWNGLRNLLFKKYETVDLLNYVPYNKEDAKATIIRELDWRDYGGKHYESVFTRFYQSYILPEKFGIDKRRAHLSTLICSGQMTREEALNKMNEPICDPALLASDKEYVIKKLGLTTDEFEGLMQLSVQKHRNYPSYIDRHWKWQFAVLRFLKPLNAFFRKSA